jgi:hypothetical protein
MVHSLQKYVDQIKDDIPIKRMKKGKWYTNKDCKHIKNEVIYVSKRRESSYQWVSW